MRIDVEHVRIVEVGPRDGLQNERAFVPPDVKVEFITALARAGLRTIEAGAFVHPEWIPQMADTAEVYEQIPKNDEIDYPVLVPNERGLDRALEADVQSIAIFTAASETFNKRNVNMSIDESFRNFVPVVARAREHGLKIRGYVSCSLGCPYEGDVPPEKVLEVTARLLDLDCTEVSIGDTIGVGTPLQVQGLLALLMAVIPPSRLAMHFHDTRGTALVNTLAALEMGISTFDASAGGLGGCPYAPGASGNLATEDLVYLMAGMGIETGVDLDALVAASSVVAPWLDHPLPGKVLQACSPSPLGFGTNFTVQ